MEDHPPPQYFPDNHPIYKLNAIDQIAIIAEVTGEMAHTHLVGQYYGLVAAAQMVAGMSGSTLISENEARVLQAASIALAQRAKTFIDEVMEGKVHMADDFGREDDDEP